MKMEQRFRALVVERTADGGVAAAVRERTTDDLPEGELLVRVAYSSVNYKDGLAIRPDGKILTRYPMVPGIDLAGVVVASEDDRFRPGDRILATGYGLGVSHEGGFSEWARLPADWAVPLPEGMTLKEGMALGTAGFTAALSVHRLLEWGLTPERGPVLVTGATGGVGSMAVAILARLGFTVVASTGKTEAHDFLRRLGASEVLDREAVAAESRKALEKERWAAAVDPVGGRTTPSVLKAIRYGGAIALSGLAGGSALETTVFPFILRGVSLLGIDSVYCPMSLREELWHRLAGPWKPPELLAMTREVGLDGLIDALEAILRGAVQGRIVVRLGGEEPT